MIRSPIIAENNSTMPLLKMGGRLALKKGHTELVDEWDIFFGMPVTASFDTYGILENVNEKLVIDCPCFFVP